MTCLSFIVTGAAITQGSKTVLGRGGYTSLVDRNDIKTKTLPANRLKDWRKKIARVADSARQARGWEVLPGPVSLECEFFFTRPKSHLLKSGQPRKEVALAQEWAASQGCACLSSA